MRSSSTEPPGQGAPPTTPRRRGFWPGGVGAWTRLSLVVVLGAGALVAPAIGATTGALYTDTETAGFDVIPSVPPTPPTPEATTTAPAETTPEQAPAALTAEAPVLPPSGSEAATDAPTTSSAPAPTPTATPTQQAGQERPHASWPVRPPHRGR